jgi:hypothetical protein
LTGQGAAIDTTTAAGKLVFGIFAALAEFERELIRERTIAGLVAARARGRNGGRKPKMSQPSYVSRKPPWASEVPSFPICAKSLASAVKPSIGMSLLLEICERMEGCTFRKRIHSRKA